MSALTLNQVAAMHVRDVAAMPADALLQLKTSAADRLASAKSAVEHIDRALNLKYADRAQQLRLAAGKDAGVLRFDDGQVRVSADLPKKVEWDQSLLADLVRRISDNGDDPAEYIEISYRVSETKFNAWPESLKSSFVPARTLKTGKPSFTLAIDGSDA
jgi:hypothetical protein